ncbi:unnamed protein product [Gadus morhua 'NCC']
MPSEADEVGEDKDEADEDKLAPRFLGNHVLSADAPPKHRHQQNDTMSAKDSEMIADAVLKSKKYLEDFKNIQLNIAITGECGAGKSTFVNAFREIDCKDDEAAPTGEVETTMKAMPYPHPKLPNVTLWDLPGVGTTKFPADKYLKHVKFEQFDFFIIVSADRFSENDAKLAKEIMKMGKRFYFVRSKIDHNLRDAERSQRDYNKENKLQQIRKSCIQGLEAQGMTSPRVFLVSSFDLHLYDFPALQDIMERELDTLKRDVLILALPNVSVSTINKKKEVFRSQIKYYALLSAAVAIAPIPGLSVGVDIGILVILLTTYVLVLGLDLKTLLKLSTTSNIPLADIMAGCKCLCSGKEINAGLIIAMLGSLSLMISAAVLEEGSRLIPVLGCLIAATVSFTSIMFFLRFVLDSLCDDATYVLKKFKTNFQESSKQMVENAQGEN